MFDGDDMESAEPVIEWIIKIANAMNPSKVGPHTTLYSEVDRLCDFGLAARIAGLKLMYRVDNMVVRMGVSASLILKQPDVRDGIYDNTLEALCTSTQKENVALFWYLDGSASR